MAEESGPAAFEPQNELEIELVRAAHEPALRDAFLRELPGQPVFLALLLAGGARVETGPDGGAVIPAGARLELGAVERGGERALPFFSAPIRAQTFYRQDHVVAPDRAGAVFARHPGTRFVLNPGSDYALDLGPDEAAALIGHAGSGHGHVRQ